MELLKNCCVRFREMSSMPHGSAVEITACRCHFYCRLMSHHSGVIERFLRSLRISLQ